MALKIIRYWICRYSSTEKSFLRGKLTGKERKKRDKQTIEFDI
jgi:hypothetical protein